MECAKISAHWTLDMWNFFSWEVPTSLEALLPAAKKKTTTITSQSMCAIDYRRKKERCLVKLMVISFCFALCLDGTLSAPLVKALSGGKIVFRGVVFFNAAKHAFFRFSSFAYKKLTQK